MRMKVLTDSELTRDRFARALVALGTLFVIPAFTAFLAYLVSFIFPIIFPGKSYLFAILGIILGASFVARISPRFLVTNPANLAFVTQNPFSYSDNQYVPYGPGWHFSFPWEQRQTEGNVPLNLITEHISERIPSRTGEVTLDISVQLFVRNPVAFFIATASSVQLGLRDTVREWLAKRVAELSADEAVSRSNQLSNEIDEVLRGRRSGILLETYGISIVNARIQSIDLSKKMQSARDTQDQAKAIIYSMANVLGYSTAEDMYRDVRAGKLTIKDMRAVREDVLAMAGVLQPRVSRLDLSGIKAKDSTAAAIFAAINER